jgi:hypothetical protein
MGKLSGTVLILAGVSIAAYTLSAQQDATPKAGAKVATAESTVLGKPSPPPPSAPAPLPKRADASPPRLADSLAAGATAPTPTGHTPPAKASPPTALAPPPVAPQKLRPGAPAAVQVAEAPLRLPVGETAATASPPLDRPALTREIQRHLKRIGCYQGDVSGVWSPAVRQAVRNVTDRVNASLPIDQPDPVLLAMVQSQEPGTCGASCPKGQSRAADGRCLPAALVANAGKVPKPTASTRAGPAKSGPAQTAYAKTAPPAGAAPADVAAPPPPPDGRMSLAGPAADTPRQARARPQRSRATSKKATAYYRPSGPRMRQRSAQRSGSPFWIPFLMP